MAKGKFQEWLTDDGLLRIEGWARDGLTDEQIAGNMGIAARTLYEWVKQYPQLYQALKNGKAPADIAVENALYKRAVGGFTITETRTEVWINGKGEERGRHVTTIEREVAPDVTAQIYWLKNRKPQQWRDKRDVEVAVSDDPLTELFKRMDKDARSDVQP